MLTLLSFFYRLIDFRRTYLLFQFIILIQAMELIPFLRIIILQFPELRKVFRYIIPQNGSILFMLLHIPEKLLPVPFLLPIRCDLLLRSRIPIQRVLLDTRKILVLLDPLRALADRGVLDKGMQAVRMDVQISV